MRLAYAATALSALARAIPDVAFLPKNPIVRVEGWAPHHGFVRLARSGEYLDAIFPVFYLKSGPTAKPVHWRERCRLLITLSLPAGHSFSIHGARVFGYAKLAKGAEAQFEATYTVDTGGRVSRVSRIPYLALLGV